MRVAPPAQVVAQVALALTLAAVAARTQQAASALPAGTAAIGGVVINAGELPRPVRRAIVTLTGRSGGLSRGAITDDEGRFAIGSLPAGTYTLTVSKPAYLTTTFGANGADRPGTPIELRDGQAIVGLRIPLMRGAVLTGTIRDHAGEPAREVRVFAARVDTTSTDAQSSSSRSSPAAALGTTDDTGTYRIYGLAPGAYIVGATPRLLTAVDVSVLTRAQVDEELRALQQRRTVLPGTQAVSPSGRFSYAPVFHPSTTSAEQSVIVTLSPGEERRGVDVSLALVPIAAIEGTVVGADGRPVSNVALSIARPGPQLPARSFGQEPLLSPPGPDGVFRYTNVAPGTYTLSARSTTQVIQTISTGARVMTGRAGEVPPGTFYWAMTTVGVNGADVTGVALYLRPALTMTGRVVFEGATRRPPANLTQVRLSLKPEVDRLARPPNTAGLVAVAAAASLQPDGTFELKGLTPAVYVLGAEVPGGIGPHGWWLRSAILEGRDLLDRPLRIEDSDLTNVVITFSDRHTEIAGTLETPDGQPATDYVVVAIPEDRALWSSARRVQNSRPATSGRFAFADLPPGEYVIAALTDLPDDWRTTEFLSGLAAAGVNVTIAKGERKMQNLRILRR